MEDEILVETRAELDTLLINMEAAVRVEKRSDFFSWVQGVFQGLLAHEALICVVAHPTTRAFTMDWMSSYPIDPQCSYALCYGTDALIYRLMSQWKNQRRKPVLVDGRHGAWPAEPAIADEIDRLALHNIAAHGMPDIEGNTCSFFCFFKLSGGLRQEQADRLELATPFLHAAWTRVICESGCSDAANRIGGREILTDREVEILNWVELGKSNGEIGQILHISHLTVKNHVQKILRKLGVHNRAQAVARGIELNLTRHRAH